MSTEVTVTIIDLLGMMTWTYVVAFISGMVWKQYSKEDDK